MNDRISVPAGHPAFWTVAKAAIFATEPIVELRDNLLATLEGGDERAARRAAGELRSELSLGTTEEWRHTGHPKPSTLDELKRVMALAGFDADTIHGEQWTPRSVATIVLAKLGECDAKPSGSTSAIRELTPVDVAVLRHLAEPPGVVCAQYDLEAAGIADRKTIGPRLRYLRDIGYIKHPEGKRRGNLITAAGLKVARNFPISSP